MKWEYVPGKYKLSIFEHVIFSIAVKRYHVPNGGPLLFSLPFLEATGCDFHLHDFPLDLIL